MKEADAGEAFSAKEVAEILGTSDVNEVGTAAREKTRRISGNSVYYGRLTPAEEATQDGYAEVLLSERDRVEEGAVDAFVGAPDDPQEDYRDIDAPVDVAVVYGDDGDAVTRRLDRVTEFVDSAEVTVRGVTLFPEGRTTAYTDLKTVAAARLALNVYGVRVARSEVGDKLAQTALAYGANDLGFVKDDDFDAELAAREAGFTPVDRAEAGGYGV